ncbi:MAG TPA: hypothetical protein VJ943_04430 [Desulfotignum sp.]|nr:hypothetical protein [Desulfotignum sp.]
MNAAKETPSKRLRIMPKAKTMLQQDKKNHAQTAACFYGAQKSSNELYFQIASVFREASQNDTRLAGAWMHRILMARHPEHPDNTGKLVVNSI